MPSRAHTQADWDKHADEIRELLKKKTFTEVAAFMEAEHNFAATERQYKYRFGNEKYLTEKEWKWIDLELQRRSAAGKQSHVYLKDTLQSADRVDRATARYGKRAYSEVDSNGMPNPCPKRISVRTPPALTPEPIADQPDIPSEVEEAVEIQDITVLHSTTEHSFRLPSTPDPELQLEADIQRNFDAADWTLTSPASQSPSELEAFFAPFKFFETGIEDFALVAQASPRETGRDGSPSPTFSFVIHRRVQQWMANLPIFQVQSLLEQRAHIPLQAHSVRERSPFATTSTFNGLAMDAGREALTNLLSSVAGNQLGVDFPQVVSKLEDIVPQKEPNALSKQLGYFLNSRSIPSSGLWYLFGLVAYFLSNNILDNVRTDTFLKWAIDQHFTEQLVLFVEVKTPTIEIFSVKILKSTIRIRNFELAQALLRRGVVLDRLTDETNWIDDPELTKQILDRADPKLYYEKTGSMLLRFALIKNRFDLAKRIIDKGVSVNSELDRETPLYYAAWSGTARHVRFLLECGADVDAITHYNRTSPATWTALAAAVCWKRKEIVAMLLEHHASISCKVGYMDLLEWTSLEDRNMYNLLKKSVGDVGFNLGDLIFAATEGIHSLDAYKSRYQEGITTHLLEQALHESIVRENLEAVVTLLQSGVSPDGDTLHTRPLESAIDTEKRYEICQLLINLGARVDVPGILRKVVKSEDSCHLLSLFVECQANLDHQCNGALVEAAEAFEIESVIYLLARGVDVNTSDLGWTPIQAAARSGNPEMIELLLSYNADINAPAYLNGGRTALQAALDSEWDCKAAELLLDRGANVSAPPAFVNGLTALEAVWTWWYGEEKQRRAICHRLLDAGAPINRPWGKASSVLHHMISKGEDNLLARCLEPHYNVNLEHMWVDPEVLPNGKGPQPRTPIQLAAERGHIKQVKMLLCHGADINARPAPRFGRTALQAAASTGNKELVEFLLTNMAEVSAKPAVYGGITALQGAAISGNVTLVALLLEKGARVNEEPSVLEGRYAIEGAAEHGRLDTVQFLLNAGAKGNLRRKMGFQFAIELAELNNHSHIVALLKEAEEKRLDGETENDM
ncbi:ankyrin [Periconia macrospinosa]|uniref:Ankyrin n=1 Tax=Periconia macrospinosa TaxID=97972 RepID=A0A2V1DPW4_9PLEO|nr:ankyrin [Periconia macrospinosa]